jgi:hypothetical protein
LIKFKSGKHEKDDRKHISKRENYVLGWDNKEKIAVLKKELNLLHTQQEENKKEITTKRSEIEKLGIFRDECHNLFSKFDKYDDINWESYAKEIQEKTDQKNALEQTNDRVKQLQEQLKKFRDNLKLTEQAITSKSKEIFRAEENQKYIENSIYINQSIYEPLSNVNTLEFEKNNTELLTLDYHTLEASRDKFQKENARKAKELEELKNKKESEVRIKINAFKQPTEVITNKFKDWRSDVNSLPTPPIWIL